MFSKARRSIPSILTRNIKSRLNHFVFLLLVTIRLIEDSYALHNYSIPATVGETLLESIKNANIPIRCISSSFEYYIAYCGGHCACGSCAVEMNDCKKDQDERSSQEKLVLEKVSKSNEGYYYKFML